MGLFDSDDVMDIGVIYDINEELRKENERLKAENEELKRQHQGDKGLITSTGKMNYQLLQEYDKLKTENEELKKNYFTVIQQRNVAEQQLDQLQEILDSITSIVTGYCQACKEYEPTKNCLACNYRYIKRKLNGVENENNIKEAK